MSARPLLSANGARIAIDGVTSVDELTLIATGDRVALIGDVSALMSALCAVPLAVRRAICPAGAEAADPDDVAGEAYVSGGLLEVAGKDVGHRAHLAVAGVAILDPPLPERLTAAEYVGWGARLTGMGARGAREAVGHVLGLVGLDRVAGRPLRSLALPERRAVLLAQAIVASPAVLIAEAPLNGLEDASAGFVRHALEAVSAGRRLIVSGTSLRPGLPDADLALTAEYVAVLYAGELVLAGAPAEILAPNRSYALTVTANADRFQAELSLRQIRVQGGPTHFGVVLPEGATAADLVAVAAATRAPLLALTPVLG